MPYMLGLDIGTSGAKAVLVGEDGSVAGVGNASYPLSHPRPLWSEQDPDDWWAGAKAALREAIQGDGVAPDEIVALGLTGQMHGAVFLDETDTPIRPAMLWNDGRTDAQCDEIERRVGLERLLAITGNPALEGFQAPKILWVREHEPEAYVRVRRVLLPKDYIRLLLTGDAATDASDASGTLLLDLAAREWSDKLLSALDIPRAWLPTVHESPELTGKLREQVAAELGLPAGLPVAAGGGDNAAAAVGTGIVREGFVSSSVGTSGVIFAHTDAFLPDPEGRLHAFCHAIPDKYHLMGVTLAAGGSFSWWRDLLDPEMSFGDLSAEAASAPPGADGLLFLPYLSGERTPHRDPLARGAFVGLTARHTRAHMTRAVMEGVIFSLRESLALMRNLGVQIDHVRATGGGARDPLWRELQADIYRTPVRRMRVEEGPALGAALLAGVGAGVFVDVMAASETIALHAEAQAPDPERADRYDGLFRLYRSLYPTAADIMHELNTFASSADSAGT
ncbi:MAG TPA: xylulokinase [Thermomicrobiales bacterium]|nr:xylulokinase [Thermomicrobiales bacterium]